MFGPFLKPRKDGRKSENQAEFAAYSIIYCLYTKNMTDMTKRLSQLSEDMAKDSLISDALKLRSHLSLGNYLVSRFIGLFLYFERIFMVFLGFLPNL